MDYGGIGNSEFGVLGRGAVLCAIVEGVPALLSGESGWAKGYSVRARWWSALSRTVSHVWVCLCGVGGCMYVKCEMGAGGARTLHGSSDMY